MDSQSPPNEVVQNISVAGKLAGLTGAGASCSIIPQHHDGLEMLTAGANPYEKQSEMNKKVDVN